jgi:heme exporter protein C
MRIGGPRIDPTMLAPLLIMSVGFTLAFVCLLLLRMRTILNERKATALRLNAGFAPTLPTRPDRRAVARPAGR